MEFLPHVVRAKYEKGFRIQLTFNEGTVASVDFEPWLSGPVFEPLKRLAYFRKFFVDGGTVVWPNGADIAPETLYEAAQATRSNTYQASPCQEIDLLRPIGVTIRSVTLSPGRVLLQCGLRFQR